VVLQRYQNDWMEKAVNLVVVVALLYLFPERNAAKVNRIFEIVEHSHAFAGLLGCLTWIRNIVVVGWDKS
jgi:hypothetical protein